MELLKLAVRLPVIFVLIVATAMGSWVAFWFIVRAAVYLHERYLSDWWH